MSRPEWGTRIAAISHREVHVVMTRLLDVVGLPREDLFRSREDLVSEALTRQEVRVAYVDEKLAAETTGGSQ